MKKKLKPLGPAGKLIQKGWCKGTFSKKSKDGKLKVCSQGAIWKAYGGFDVSSIDAERKLRAVIGNSCITFWNDHSKRTKRQVLAAFRKAGI